MLTVNDKDISLTKGDTLILEISMKDDQGHVYTPQEGDVVRFAMKRWYSDTQTVITKVIPNDTMTLRLEHAETAELKVGKYVYDIEITYADGRVDTFVDRASFRITEEVA